MRHSLRTIALTAGVATAAMIATVQPSASAMERSATGGPEPAPPSALAQGALTQKNTGGVAAPKPAPAPASVRSQGQLSQTNRTSRAGVCVFFTKGDHVHRSSTGFAASGHGWWLKGSCHARLAVVTVQLQQFYSDGRWRNIGRPGKKTVRPGGGAGNRATGRVGCHNAELTGWRSVIDVDLVGVPDDPRKLTTPARNIRCRW